MNNDIRQFYLNLIDMANTFPNIPWECKRLAFENVLNKVQKQADEAIQAEVGNEIHVDTLVLGGEEDAEMLREN